MKKLYTIALVLGTFLGSFGITYAISQTINLAAPYTWTALQQFGNASTTQLTSSGSAYLATQGGNVGIGTTAPGATLDVSGNARIFNQNTSGVSSLTLKGGSGQGYTPYMFVTDNAGNNLFLLNWDGSPIYYTSGTPQQTFTYGSNYMANSVGLIWNNNTSVFAGSVDTSLSRGAAGKLYVGNGSVGDYSGTLIAGNVGIGTTGPATALDVHGDITDENVKSQGCIGTDSNGKIINGTCSGTNYWTNTGNDTLLTTGIFADVPATGGYNIGGQLLAYASSTNLDTIFGLGAGGQNATTSATLGVNSAFGYKALNSNTTGNNNTANGYQSLDSNTTGSYNTANGAYSLFSNTTGTDNTANGYDSLNSNTTGTDNTANGYQSLFSNTTASYNAAFGRTALALNTTGSANTAVGGRSALYTNTTGASSTAIGYQTLFSNVSGNQNTALGIQAGYSETGSNNLYLGAYTASTTTSGSNNIAIGYDVATPSITSSNTLNIGNLIFGTGINGEGTTLSTGNIGIATTSPYAPLSVVGTGGVVAESFTATSTTVASTFPYASTTMISATTASSSNYYGGQLFSCNGASNALTWNAGTFGCNSIAGGSGTYPFTPSTNYSATAQATTGIVWFKNGLQASSTSQIAYASTTMLSATTASTTNLYVSSVGEQIQCLHTGTDGLITGTGSDCGSGGGGGGSQWATSTNQTSIYPNVVKMVGIATTTATTTLDVNGAILTEEITPATSTSMTIHMAGANATSSERIGVGKSNMTINIVDITAGAIWSPAICETMGTLQGSTTLTSPTGWTIHPPNGASWNTSVVLPTTMIAGWCDKFQMTADLGTSSPLGSGTPFISVQQNSAY